MLQMEFCAYFESPDNQSTRIEFIQETIRIPCKQKLSNCGIAETMPKGSSYEQKHRRYLHRRIAHD
jgi:hypothetical protein